MAGFIYCVNDRSESTLKAQPSVASQLYFNTSFAYAKLQDWFTSWIFLSRRCWKRNPQLLRNCGSMPRLHPQKHRIDSLYESSFHANAESADLSCFATIFQYLVCLSKTTGLIHFMNLPFTPMLKAQPSVASATVFQYLVCLRKQVCSQTQYWIVHLRWGLRLFWREQDSLQRALLCCSGPRG